MKPIQVARDILPLANFKTQASKVFRQMQESNRPVVITLNGAPAGVLITPEEFDRLTEHKRFLESVRTGLDDLEAGRALSDAEARAELEAEFGAFEEE